MADAAGTEMVDPATKKTVDIFRIWQCKGKLLQWSGSDQGASRRRDLCLSFALFKILRLRFATDHVGNIDFGEDKCRDFVLKGLLSDDEDLDRAFRVVEAELGFLFDFFYARYPSIKDTLAPDLIVYAAILATSIFTLFCPDLKHRPTGFSANIFIHGFNLDLLVTRLVIVWYILLESYQFLSLFIFSDWHKVKMLCRYVRKESWHRALVEIPLKFLCHFTFTKYWKGSIGQYFVFENVHPHPFKSFLSWISLETLDSSLMTKSISLPPQVRQAVLRQLKDIKGKITDGRMWLCEMGVTDLDLDRDIFYGQTYARYIMTWHIATSICSIGLTVPSKENASEEFVKNYVVATKLSGYCAYLLAFKPDLLPDDTYRSLSIARGTLHNAREYLGKCKSNEEKYKKLIKLGSSKSTDYEVGLLSEGSRIAVYFIDRFVDVEERWRLLAVFWANMMLYIAPSDRAVAHATRMATGGEFITLIWALVTHAHIIGKVQPPGGMGDPK
ncbi:hypothetical protein VPH35_038588 [Triticum aestivum]